MDISDEILYAQQQFDNVTAQLAVANAQVADLERQQTELQDQIGALQSFQSSQQAAALSSKIQSGTA